MMMDLDFEQFGERSIKEMGIDIKVGFYNPLNDEFTEINPKLGSIEIRSSLF